MIEIEAHAEQAAPVEPIEREFKRKGKGLMVFWFCISMGLVVLGLFSERELHLGPLTISRNWFPLGILFSLAGGVLSILAFLGPERCRVCHTTLSATERRYLRGSAKELLRAVEMQDASLAVSLERTASDEGAVGGEGVCLLIGACAEHCLKAGTIELRVEQNGSGSGLYSRRTLTGSAVADWLRVARAGRL